LAEQVRPYGEPGSQKYVYQLKPSDLDHELARLGRLYHTVYQRVKTRYPHTEEFRVFERAYNEHFTVVEGEAVAKGKKELDSGMLQSPDDQDATYREKGDQKSKGYTINATETANPENSIQLLTDIAVNKNNVDDSRIIEARVDKIVEKTPDLDELHTDGGYGSEAVDKKMEEHGIALVTTAVRGRESKVEKTITRSAENEREYTVECPRQEVKSAPTAKKNRAVFDTGTCAVCPLSNECAIFKNNGRYYFTEEDHLRNRRNGNINKIPEERRKIRPNVEATIKEFKNKTQAGKLKVRGQFKASLFAFAMGISINFGRIYRLIVSKGEKYGDFLASFRAFVLQILTLMEPAQISALKIKKQTNFQISYLSVLYRGLKM
jgi:hypothetical protein